MTLRFAILKEIRVGDDKKETVVLEYNDEQILNRLKKRVAENLPAKRFKQSWSKQELRASIDKAFQDLVTEFKEKTIRLP